MLNLIIKLIIKYFIKSWFFETKEIKKKKYFIKILKLELKKHGTGVKLLLMTFSKWF